MIRKFFASAVAVLVVAGSGTAAMAHDGDAGHEHPQDCRGALLTTSGGGETDGMCIVYAHDGKTIRETEPVTDGTVIDAVLLPDAAPETVFSNPYEVSADMDIGDPALQKYRTFYDSQHFTLRESSTPKAELASDGTVQQGSTILAAIGGGEAAFSQVVGIIADIEADGQTLQIFFNDGALCQAHNWDLHDNYFGWYWGTEGGRSFRVDACLQFDVQLTVHYTDGTSTDVTFRVKDNHNGADSVLADPQSGPPQPADDATLIPAPVLTVMLAAERGWVSEDNGRTTFTVSLSRPLEAGETVKVPLTVGGSKRDWSIRLRPRDNGPGVQRTGTGKNTEVTFTEGGQTATFTLIGRPDDSDGRRKIRIGFGRGDRAPTATGVEGGIALANTHVRIQIRDAKN